MQVPLRGFDIALEIDDGRLVTGRRAAVSPNVPDMAAALRQALDAPIHFPPLRRALTADDRVAIVIDERLPQLGAMVGELVAYLIESGLDPAAVTLVSAAGSQQRWIDDLPDSAQDVRTEIHDPGNRKVISYLASTSEGRRVYLNRTVVEADQTIVLAGCRYDTSFGIHDGPGTLFPAMSDEETTGAVALSLSMESPDGEEWPLHQEATEVSWLLGVPFMIHVIEGTADGASHIVAGTTESLDACRNLLMERWRLCGDRPAQLVIATLTGDPARHDVEAISRAALCAARVVEPGGRIVVMSRANPEIGEAMSLLRGTDDLEAAARAVRERMQAADRSAALQWLEAARLASLYLLSELPDETVEELFATPLQQPKQVQRLIDAASSCLVIEDADKSLAVLD